MSPSPRVTNFKLDKTDLGDYKVSSELMSLASGNPRPEEWLLSIAALIREVDFKAIVAPEQKQVKAPPRKRARRAMLSGIRSGNTSSQLVGLQDALGS